MTVTAMDTILSKDQLDETDPGYQKHEPEKDQRAEKPRRQGKDGRRKRKNYNAFVNPGNEKKEEKKDGNKNKRQGDNKDKHEQDKDAQNKKKGADDRRNNKKRSRRETIEKEVKDDEPANKGLRGRGGRRGGRRGGPYGRGGAPLDYNAPDFGMAPPMRGGRGDHER